MSTRFDITELIAKCAQNMRSGYITLTEANTYGTYYLHTIATFQVIKPWAAPRS